MGGIKYCLRKGPAYFATWGDSGLMGLSSQQSAKAVWEGEGHLIKVMLCNPPSGPGYRNHACL